MATEDEKKIRRKIDDLSERSDQVKDILGQAPNWVIQWGISVVFIRSVSSSADNSDQSFPISCSGA